MILGTGCLGAGSLNGEAIRSALGALELDQALLRFDDDAEPNGLEDLRVAGVRAHATHVPRALDLCRHTRSPRLVLDLPADLDLDRACRALFDLARRHAGLGLVVTTPREGPLASVESTRLLLEDLSARGIGYWHCPSTVRLAGGEDASWLDALGRWLVGMSLDDVAQGEAGLPPGLGEIDFGVLAGWNARELEVALDVSAVPDPVLLRMTLDELASAGFR